MRLDTKLDDAGGLVVKTTGGVGGARRTSFSMSRSAIAWTSPFFSVSSASVRANAALASWRTCGIK